MQVCFLGPLIIRDGAIELPAGGRLQRRVLARLAMEAGTPVATDDLESAAWGDDPPAAARHTIATHVFRLRRLGLEFTTRDDGYVLETPTDAGEVEQLAADSRRAVAEGDPTRAIGALREALALWRGRPLADLDDLPEVTIVAARLEELAENLREELLALKLDHGRPAELVAQARQLAAAQPYRERRWELLMLALYRAGRQADALDAYAECRRRLLDDLGLDPGTALRRMQQAVLAQDPALEPPIPAPEPSAAARPTQGVSESGSTVEPSRIPGTSTRLIGRAVEQRDLAEVWDRARLATVLGPPGAGKTRLALELARAADPSAWYVALEQIPAAQSVAAAILDVVAPSSRATDASRGIRTALGTASGLLVLDGCEGRPVEIAREVGQILGACPRIRVLATSRERLGILDEALIPLGPLAAGDAIDLLVDRARLLDPRFRLGPAEMAIADRLCALVDRLPLGIELVARHLQLLRIDEVVRLVESDLGRWAGRPAGGRAGLWAALDTSVERLGPSERQALLALAVMVTDADIALIEAVASFTDRSVDAFEVVARLVDASLVQVRSAPGPTRYELLNTVAAHTLEGADERELAASWARYANAVLARADQLAGQLATADRSDTLRLLDREMPHVRAVLGMLTTAPVDPAGVSRGLEIAVGLTDYWLGRHPAEGLDWLGRLIEAAGPAPAPTPALRAAALLSRGHLAYWVTDFTLGARVAEEAQALFASLGDPLGEGRALRRRGAIAAATDDLAAARSFLEASLSRLEAAGVERETGTTLLHLGSLLADEGIVDAARPALERALSIAVETGDPLANGHVLAALNLAHWKGGDLEAAMRTGNEALLIFRELGHRPTEGTVAYRLAAVSRGLAHPRAARRYAQIAIDAGEQSSTRTTVALGHLNLARLDIDATDYPAGAGHLARALELVDLDADRWVLVECLEAVARLLAATSRTGSGRLLDAANRIRIEIRQPVAPTEAGDLEWTLARSVTLDEPDSRRDRDPSAELDAAAAHALALGHARDAARPVTSAPRRRRARG
jgi:predicted ATPase/DNA-binding SARP family transcriptional activator